MCIVVGHADKEIPPEGRGPEQFVRNEALPLTPDHPKSVASNQKEKSIVYNWLRQQKIGGT